MRDLKTTRHRYDVIVSEVAGEVSRVDPVVAIKGVVLLPTGQMVITVVAFELVVALLAQEIVVAAIPAQNVLTATSNEAVDTASSE